MNTDMAMTSMKAQGQIEALTVAGIVLLFVTMAFIFTMNYLSESAQSAQARNAMDLLGKEADYVYANGPGTVRYVDVVFPSGTESLNISGNRIHMVIGTPSGSTDYYMNLKGTAAGGLRYYRDRQVVRMEYLENGIIEIGDLKLACFPDIISMRVQQNSSEVDELTITNLWFSNLTGITVTPSGAIASFFTRSTPPSSLMPQESSAINVTAAPSLSVPSGIYIGQLVCNSSQGYDDITEIIVDVYPVEYLPSRCSITPAFANVSKNSYRFFATYCYDAMSQAVDCPELNWSCNAGIMFPPQSNIASTLFTTVSGGGTYLLTADAGNFSCNASVSVGAIRVIKPILFITQGSSPNPIEQRWISWINNHTSGEGYNWSMDIYPDAAVRNGSVNVYDYKMVVMATFSSISGIEVPLIPYMQAGGVVTLLDDAAMSGPMLLGYSASLGFAGWANKIYVLNNAHYVTANQSLGYTAITANYSLFYTAPADVLGTHLAQFSQTNAGVMLSAMNATLAQQLCVWGVYDPTNLNANGNLLTTRIIDYCLGATYVANFTNIGPIVSSLYTVPYYPDTNSSITVKAIGDDTGRGNDTIQTCQLSLDGAAWQTMNPEDGVYDSVVEPVNLSIGNLSFGQHNVTVKCQDLANLWGPERTKLFNVTNPGKGPGGKIVFITNNPNPDTKERKWMTWIDTHSSAEGYNWTYNVTSRGDVLSGAFNITGYRLVIMAKYTPGVGIDAVLGPFMQSGGVVLLIGDSMEFGPKELNYTLNQSTSSTETQMYFTNVNHYITDGMVPGKQAIASATTKIWRTPGFNGSGLAWGVSSNVKVENETALGDSSVGLLVQLVLWGPDVPDSFNSNGNLLFTRIIDYCLGGRWFGGQTGPVVTHLYTDPEILYDTTFVKLNATGDDTFRGDTNVTMCQVSVDGAAWQNMSASDGAYNNRTENVNYSAGNLTYGLHIAAAKCQNALGYWGPTEQITFRVFRPFTPLLFVTDGPNPDSGERAWTDWLSSHSSGVGYNWSYAQASKQDVVQENVLLVEYQLVIMSSYQAATAGLPQKISDFMTSGGAVLFLGRALDYGPRDLGYTSQSGTSNTETQIYIVNNTHYVMRNQSVGYMTIASKQGPLWRSRDALGGTNIADGTKNNNRQTNESTIADRSGRFMTWGFDAPADLNPAGINLTTRVIDYCLGAR